MLSGSWFQAAGPAYEKARSPSLAFRRDVVENSLDLPIALAPAPTLSPCKKIPRSAHAAIFDRRYDYSATYVTIGLRRGPAARVTSLWP